MREEKFEKIAVGDEAEIVHTITANDLDLFASI